MKIHRVCIATFFALSARPLVGCAEEPLLEVSLIQLIATPEKYEGKLVALTGYVHLEFEGNGIYLHKDDYRWGLHKNGMWLSTSKCESINKQKFTDGYAYVIARFTSSQKGHMGLWSGELQDVKSCSSLIPFSLGT